MPDKTINEAFAEVFGRVRRERVFTSMPNRVIPGKIEDNAEIKAAISKCIDFNVIVNRGRSDEDEAFLFLSGLRGIVEDLILLKYSLKFPSSTRTAYFEILKQLNLRQGILAQKKFFKANNPFQNVVGFGIPMQEAQRNSDDAKAEFRAFWKAQGHPKKMARM